MTGFVFFIGWKKIDFLIYYRGLTPSLISTIPHSGIELTMYEYCKKCNFLLYLLHLVFQGNSDAPITIPYLLLSAGISSSTSQILCYPLHVVKARLATQGWSNIFLTVQGPIQTFPRNTLEWLMFSEKLSLMRAPEGYTKGSCQVYLNQFLPMGSLLQCMKWWNAI